MMDDWLNRYFSNAVTIKKQHSKEMKKFVLPHVRNILQRVHELDPRFGNLENSVHAGSAFQKLKVKRFDEFDFTVPVVSLANLHWVNPPSRALQAILSSLKDLQTQPPEETALQLTKDVDLIQRHKDMMSMQFVIPSKARNIFLQQVLRAISALGYKGLVEVSSENQSPTTLTMYQQLAHSPRPVSVDLMVMCPVRLPFDSWVEWPRRNQVWPADTTITEIKSKGIAIVAKKDETWTLSFVECEKVLMSCIDADGGVRKKCHRIMKGLLQDFWCLKGEENTLTSYHLKNLLFWECELYHRSLDWQHNFLAARILSMTESLLRCLTNESLTVYFYPDINLFENRSRENLLLVASRVADTFSLLANKYSLALPSPRIQPYLGVEDHQIYQAPSELSVVEWSRQFAPGRACSWLTHPTRFSPSAMIKDTSDPIFKKSSRASRSMPYSCGSRRMATQNITF